MDDAAAIKKCLEDGDQESFRFLVERYQNQALAHSIAILGRCEDAPDAVQEAFIDAFKALRRFDRSRRFYPWFYVLLRHRCYKQIAKRTESESLEDLEILAPGAALPDEERFELEKALRALSKEDREIIALKYLDGLSYEELAEYLEIPKGTVMSRLFYARKHLQAKLTGKSHSEKGNL